MLGIFYAMQDLGYKEIRPKKNAKTQGWKDKSNWSGYHKYFGHLTKNCFAHIMEISYILSKGHSKELLGRSKDKTNKKSL